MQLESDFFERFKLNQKMIFQEMPALMGVVELVEDDILHLESNDAALGFFGKKENQMKNKFASELGFPRRIIDLWKKHSLESKILKAPVCFEYWHDGLFLSVAVRNLSFIETRSIFTYVIQNITEIKNKDKDLQIEKSLLIESLKEKNKKIELITESVPILLWTSAPEGGANYFNRRWYEFTGQTPESAMGNGCMSAVHPEDLENLSSPWTKSQNFDETIFNEYRLRNSEGNYKWFLGQQFAIKDALGNIVEWFGAAVDIDLQKRANEITEKEITIRDEFLAIASHELKTPVTSLILHLKILQDLVDPMDLDGSSQKIIDSVKVANRQAQYLAHLIENLLVISKEKLGKIVIVKERVNLLSFVQEVSKSFISILNRSECTITIDIDPKIFVEIDKIKFEQVLANLLSNSAKYATKSLITVSGVATSKKIILRFSDTGPGVASELRASIFNKFTRAEMKPNRSGLGLGLYISKQMIEGHGGNILLENNNQNKGTCFIIEFPV
jgi:PAS domain S-box-containing protein